MKNLKHLFTALLLLCVTAVAAHDFEVGGIYYNILSETDKTVEVTFKGLEYDEYSDEYSGSVVIPSTVVTSGTISTVLKTYDAWASTNKGNGGTTSQTSYTLNVAAGNILKFDWSVSSESGYDWLIITLDGTEIITKSGTLSGSYKKAFDAAGSHTLVVKYTKDDSVNNGNDEGKIFNVTLNATLNSVDRITYSVTSIGNEAFRWCTGLTSITIPNSVTSIGGEAFMFCSGLKKVCISDLTAWCNIDFDGPYANPLYFANNLYLNGEKVTNLVIPNNVTSIGEWAFNDCTGLTSVVIGNSVTSIGRSAFEDCTGLTSVVIGNSVTSIGDYAFDYCTGLTSITIPNSVTSIGNYAFCGCSGLTSITIPNSVTSIGQHAFECCYELKSFTSLIPAEDLYSIISNVFDYVDQTTCTLYVPYGAKETYAATEGWNEFTNIVEMEPEYDGKCGENAYWKFDKTTGTLTITGEGAMYNYSIDNTAPWYSYTSINNVIINDGITTIGECAFEYCSGLTSVVIPNTVTTIGDYAFYYCGNLISAPIPNSITNIGYYAFLGCSNLTSVTIPNSVTTIERGAFARCGFTNIVIPSSVTSIEEGAFAACHNLANIVVDENNPVYDSRENCNAIIDTESNKLIAACRNTVIPNSVTIIENYAFMECYSHTSLEIHNGVTTIGESAFRDCDNLTSVEIPNSVTSIGDYAFYECDGLTSITSLIPADKLFVPGSYAFWCVPTNCTLYVPFGAKETYAATEGWSEFTNIVELGKPASDVYFRILSEEEKTAEIISGENKYTGDVVIPESVIYNGEEYRVTSIGDEAFANCTGLTNIEIPNSVTSIGEWAFANCTGITSIEIPSSVTSFGDEVFYGCSGLTSIEIPNGVGSLGARMFRGCSNLESIVDHREDITIYGSTLSHCYGLKSFEIPNSVTYVGAKAFRECTGLTSIVIPDCVYYIGEFAFYNCSNLKSVVLPDSLKCIESYTFYGCTNLASVVIPNSVTSIGINAFESCRNLTSVVIPSSVTSLAYMAFGGCRGLTSVTSLIPAENLFGINLGVFKDVDKNACTLYVPYGAKETYASTTGWNEFTNIVELGKPASDVYFRILSEEEKTAEIISGENKYTGDVVIPESVIYNGEEYRVTSIGENAFFGCSSLVSVVIGNSVTSIGIGAFWGCTGLTSITIPNSVTSIEGSAFRSCTGLTSITIPNSVTSIGGAAFLQCSSLTSITIPNSVTSIGLSAFYNCTRLTSITIPNSVTSIGDRTFCSCSGLTSITIPNSVTSIGLSAFYNCTRLTSIEIPNSVTSIGEGAFYNCYDLKSIEIPNSVTSIGEWAFHNCYALKSVTSLIPADKLFEISYNTFKYSDIPCLYVPYGAKETYVATEGWKEFANIVELAPAELTITINQYGCATYCSPYSLDFSEVDGLKAYTATGYKSNSQVVTLTRVQTAEAGVGLFLKGEPGEYIVPVIESTDEHSLNMLVGTLEQTTVNSTDGAMSNYKFTIAEGDTAPMFYPFEDNTTFSAGKAYLQIPTAWLPATAQKSLSARFDDGETTDIDELKGESGEVKTIYDLQGRVVENPTSGIYIIGGKKVIIK